MEDLSEHCDPFEVITEHLPSESPFENYPHSQIEYLPHPPGRPDVTRDVVHIWRDDATGRVLCLGAQFMRLRYDYYRVNGFGF